jgi:hypothetical protein
VFNRLQPHCSSVSFLTKDLVCRIAKTEKYFSSRTGVDMMYVLLQGVVEYSLSLFFAKLVSYTFLYWLPLYIKSSSKSGHA